VYICSPANRTGARYVRLGSFGVQTQATSPAAGDFWGLVQEQVFGGSPTGFQILLAATGVAALATWSFKAVSRQARRISKRIEK